MANRAPPSIVVHSKRFCRLHHWDSGSLGGCLEPRPQFVRARRGHSLGLGAENPALRSPRNCQLKVFFWPCNEVAEGRSESCHNQVSSANAIYRQVANKNT